MASQRSPAEDHDAARQSARLGLHRLHPGKTEVRIYDYVDREVPMLRRMFEKRLRGYRAIGYARGEAPLGYVEEIIRENDEDIVRSQMEDYGDDW